MQLDDVGIQCLTKRTSADGHQGGTQIFVLSGVGRVDLHGPAECPRNDVEEDRALVGVAGIQRGLGDPGGVGNRDHRRRVVAVLQEHLDRGLSQPVVKRRSLGLRGPAAPPLWRRCLCHSREFTSHGYHIGYGCISWPLAGGDVS